ncbi:MAG TPA: hypothetical protein VKS82_08925 [Streptosporangiaceae bacterium]|nr:hypothetical protein [Streptosporangiaceae bacterium]
MSRGGSTSQPASSASQVVLVPEPTSLSSRRMRQPLFPNARSVRNALERARLRHASRLLAEPGRPWTRDDLMRLESPACWPAGSSRPRTGRQPAGGPPAEPASDVSRRAGLLLSRPATSAFRRPSC